MAADYSQKQHAMYYFTDDTLRTEEAGVPKDRSPGMSWVSWMLATAKWISSMAILLSPAGSYDLTY